MSARGWFDSLLMGGCVVAVLIRLGMDGGAFAVVCGLVLVLFGAGLITILWSELLRGRRG